MTMAIAFYRTIIRERSGSLIEIRQRLELFEILHVFLIFAFSSLIIFRQNNFNAVDALKRLG